MTAQAVEHGRAEGPGLVSVLTTRKRSDPCEFSALVARAEKESLQDSMGCFVVDAERSRLMRLRRSVGFAARCHAVSRRAHRNEIAVMVTLTYAGTNDDWQSTHMAGFMGHVRKWCDRRGFKCRYVWVAELQKRGVIHYHVCLWLPAGVKLPKPDKQGWWPYGMTKTEAARFAIPYLLKYLSKETSKTFGSFPEGSRIYGVGGLDHSLRRARRWLGLPSFVQANSSIHDDWRRAVGGGWCSPEGELFPSEFVRLNVGGEWCLMRAWTHPRLIEAHGPFSWLTDREVASCQMN